MKSSISSFFLKKSKLIALFLIFLSIFSFEVKSEESRIKTVDKLQEMLLEISAKKETVSLDKTIQSIANFYDTRKMIRMIIGDKWKKISETKRDEVTLLFGNYIAKNYIKQFSKFNSIKFNSKGTKKIGEKYLLIKSVLILDQKNKIKINYLLIDNKGWKIFDVLTDGTVSEISTKKSEFSKYLKDGGVDLLIKELRKNKN